METAKAKAQTKTRDSDPAAKWRKLAARRKRRSAEKKKRKYTAADQAEARKQRKRLDGQASDQKPTKLDRKTRLEMRRYALPPPPPGFRKDGPPVKAPPNIQGTACLTHGINVDYVFSALSNRKLSSAFSRLGPNGEYGRPSDKRGGGGTAVYTRAVGTTHNPLAHGFGVGSAVDSKVQFILSPAILERPDHVWRANSKDGGGDLPSVQFKERRGGPIDATHVKSLWAKQSENDRNYQFNSTVNAPPNERLDANEQLHYQALPLENVLKAVVATSNATFEKLMAMEGSQREDPKHGFVRMGDQMIRVILAEPDALLLDVLKNEGIADTNTGQVR